MERGFSMVNENMHTVAMQRNRIRRDEPEDEHFVFRRWADWQLLIIALWRLRRASSMVAKVPSAKASVTQAISRFDAQIPRLRILRNVGEHIDDYVLESDDRRRCKDVDRRGLQVGFVGTEALTWCLFRSGADVAGREGTLRLDVVVSAAEDLYTTVRSAKKSFVATLG